jgi:hypothetical protein
VGLSSEEPMACHSEGATRSKLKFLKPRRLKNLRFKPAGKIRFDLTQQKKQTVVLETKDSSSANGVQFDDKA